MFAGLEAQVFGFRFAGLWSQVTGMSGVMVIRIAICFFFLVSGDQE
jgi:hypothetical protein